MISAFALLLLAAPCTAGSPPPGTDLTGRVEIVAAAEPQTYVVAAGGRRVKVTNGFGAAHSPLEKLEGVTVALHGTMRADRLVATDLRLSILGRAHVKGLEYGDGRGMGVIDPATGAKAKLDTGACIWVEGSLENTDGKTVIRLFKQHSAVASVAINAAASREAVAPPRKTAQQAVAAKKSR